MNTDPEPRPMDRIAPLTPLQLQSWNWAQANNVHTSVRMCAASVRISGPLHASLLFECANHVIHRHESLRTQFVLSDDSGIPAQGIITSARRAFETIDLELNTSIEQHQLARSLANTFLLERIDWSADPMFDLRLYKLSETEHVLVLALDHVICDAISCQILHNELWSTYRNVLEKRGRLAPRASCQFGDYALWLSSESRTWEQQHAPYWVDYLRGVSPLTLPHAPDQTDTARPDSVMIHSFLEPMLSGKAAHIARSESVPLSLVMLTVLSIGLSVWLKRTDFPIGFVFHGRTHTRFVNTIGLLICPIFLRLRIEAGDSFLDLLLRVHTDFCNAQNHLDYGRVGALVPDCMTHIWFNWLPENFKTFSEHRHSAVTEGLSVEPFPLKLTLPLAFCPFFSGTAEKIHIAIGHRPDLYPTEMVYQFIGLLREILTCVSANPRLLLSSAITARFPS